MEARIKSESLESRDDEGIARLLQISAFPAVRSDAFDLVNFGTLARSNSETPDTGIRFELEVSEIRHDDRAEAIGE